MARAKKQRHQIIGYHFPTQHVSDSPMGNVERKRRTTEGKTLAKYRRTDCRQLAVYVKDGNNRTLCGFVNDYDGVMWWHDVTTSGKVGRPIRIESLAPATLYEFAGVVCGSQFHVFAQRF